ncbi:hypothetical protein C8R31_101761 [Nitrosospira sp. Nsp2]|nr:hypothetical protein C8R31_101761 [Nitrosospira sp. Nsp2]
MMRDQCMTSHGVVIAPTSTNPIASDDTFSEPDKERSSGGPLHAHARCAAISAVIRTMNCLADDVSRFMGRARKVCCRYAASAIANHRAARRFLRERDRP